MAATCTSRVQLGVFDAPCPSLRLSPYENKIGGYPDFIANCKLSSPPSCKCCGGALALLTQIYCPHDSSPYHRLLHVYCCCKPVCWSKSESWLVLRSQLKDAKYEVNQKKVPKPSAATSGPKEKPSSASEWCEDLDDWGDGDDGGGDWGDGGDSGDVELVNDGDWGDEKLGNSQILDSSIKSAAEANIKCTDCGNQIEDLLKMMTVGEISPDASYSGTAPRGTVGLSSYEGPYYPAVFISVVEEPERGTLEVEELLMKYKSDHLNCDFTSNGIAPKQERRKKSGRHSGQREKGGDDANGAGGGEVYEKGVAKHGDKTFQKFHKQLSKFPQQILRYSWKGRPLLFTSDPAHLPPKESALVCKECGAACVFELQLMPTLLYILNQSLETTAVLKDSGKGDLSEPVEKVVEFGTVLVYSCSDSCWAENLTSSAHFKEGVVIVQPDLDTLNRFN